MTMKQEDKIQVGYCGDCWTPIYESDNDICPSCEIDKEHTKICKICKNEFVDLNDESNICEDCQ